MFLVSVTAAPAETASDQGKVINMKIEEIKEVVRDRYGKFAEKGGSKESC